MCFRCFDLWKDLWYNTYHFMQRTPPNSGGKSNSSRWLKIGLGQKKIASLEARKRWSKKWCIAIWWCSSALISSPLCLKYISSKWLSQNQNATACSLKVVPPPSPGPRSGTINSDRIRRRRTMSSANPPCRICFWPQPILEQRCKNSIEWEMCIKRNATRPPLDGDQDGVWRFRHDRPV